MPQLDFYNHNAHIAYPLQEQAEPGFLFGGRRLAVDAIVDAGFLLGIDADYDPQYRILLTQIVVAGANITLRFTDTAASATFDFVCSTADPFGTVYEVYANEGVTFGEAFLVIGNINLGWANGIYTASDDFFMEEAVVQSLYKGYVKQLTIGSEPRASWHLPESCGGSQSAFYTYEISASNLVGHQKFEPGYNCAIRMYPDDNVIEFGSDEGGGAGRDCPIQGSSLSGSSSSLGSVSSVAVAPTCRDIFNTINGVRPDDQGNFAFLALSAGLKITGYPSLHKVVVEFFSGPNVPYCEGS